MTKMIIFAFFILIQCSETSNKSHLKSVFPPDTRSVSTDKHLDSQIGLFYSGSEVCNAFISGQNEITTAAHCYKTSDLKDTIFTTVDGNDVLLLSVKKINIDTDIIVFNVADQASFIESSTFDPNETFSIMSVNIHTKILTVIDNCTRDNILAKHDGVIKHRCDTSFGTSGAPIVQNGKAVGVHIGTTADPQINIGIEINKQALVKESLKNLNIIPEGWGDRTLTVCGVGTSVSAFAYWGCYALVGTAVAACPTGTVGEPITLTVCIAACGAATSMCGVSTYVIYNMVDACVGKLKDL